MVLGKLNNHMQKNEMKLDPYLNTTHKINLKWIKDLNTRPDIVKLLEENIGKKLLYIGLGNDFFFGYNTKSTNINRKKPKY